MATLKAGLFGGYLPSSSLLRALTGWTVAGVAASLWSPLLALWAGLGIVGLLGVAWDAWSLRGHPLRGSREVPGALSLGVWERLGVRLDSDAARGLQVEVFDHYPTVHEARDLPALLDLPAGGWASFEYRLRPTRRGTFTLQHLEVIVRGRLDLLRRRHLLDVTDEIRVLPNFRQVSHYAIMALDHRVRDLGIHLKRRRGEGLEFFQLREYRPGDPLRQIDWKAVSRRRQLISREYQLEQNQQVVFLLDCGRRMRSVDGDIAHFDHALNAVLLVTYVALRQGDSVGLMTFSGEERWLPPVRGRGGLQVMMNGVYDLQTSNQPSDYKQGIERLWTLQRKRALVILVTNLRDDDTAELAPAIRLLRRRHLVLVASLREVALEERLLQPIQDLDDALAVAGTHHFLAARKRHIGAVRQGGVLVTDVEPPQLPVRLVSEYLDLKRSGAL